MEYHVVIPEWEWYYVKSKKAATKYWLWKDKEKLPKKYKDILHTEPLVRSRELYCSTVEGERFVKNPLKAGKENIWVFNGQDLYNAKLNWRARKTVAEYYHYYFGKYIREQLSPIVLSENTFLSVSCDIYLVKRSHMPDVSNMWLLEKFFEDALQEQRIIKDDDYRNVIESGRKRYHFVNNHSETKLIFNIKKITI